MQKVKNLEYQHKENCDEVGLEAVQNTKDEFHHHIEEEKHRAEDKKELKQTYKESELSHIALV